VVLHAARLGAEPFQQERELGRGAEPSAHTHTLPATRDSQTAFRWRGTAEPHDDPGHRPNSEVTEANTYGILKLTLHPTSYDWQFVPVPGKTFTDSGSQACH